MEFGHKDVNVAGPRQMSLQLKELFSSQRLAVVSTSEHGQPYCNLVAFASTDDLKHLVFATTRSTRKFANIDRDQRVSMLIDNRSNRISDFKDAMAVTAVGLAKEVFSPEKDLLLKVYLSKQPQLKEFVMAPSSSLIQIQVSRYYVVSRFQDVLVLNMQE